jgi:ABC-2 type transport system ATP-binding protein
MVAIQTQDLCKSYGGKSKALDGLSITIEDGLSVGYLGPNGAGKTTTMRILTGLIRPSSGKAMIEDWDIVKDSRRALSIIGYVPEVPEFYGALTPTETLSFLGGLRGMNRGDLRERIPEVLSTVGLEEKSGVSIAGFSKGMKQRLALACGLLHGPRILMLDEPTSGLDPRGRVEIREVLKSLKTSETTLFVSSHMLTEIQEVCSHVAIINRGRMLAFDSIDKVAGDARSEGIQISLWKQLDEASAKSLSEIEGVRRVTQLGDREILVLIAGDSAATEERVIRHLLDRGLGVKSYSQNNASLESLYMRLVGRGE